MRNVLKHRIAIAFTLVASLGAGTALLVPSEWLGYCFWGAVLAALIFGSLAAASAKSNPKADLRPTAKVVLWLAIGTDRPTAPRAGMEALIYFFGALAFLAGLTLGAFGAVHA